MKNEALEAAERQLAAMDRDTLAACIRRDATCGLDYSCTLTTEQEMAPLFTCVARAAAARGHGYLIPWLWDRYCDGQSLAEAHASISEAVARRVEDRRRARAEAGSAQPSRPALPTPKRVGADMASEREWSDDGHWGEP